MNDTAGIIREAITQVLDERGKPVKALKPDDPLMAATGMDSLDLAVLVVKLEDSFGFDPFRSGGPAVRTFADLVAAYDGPVETGR